MKLFYGGYGKYQDYTVAENEEEAVQKIKTKLNIDFLPVKVKEIDGIDGFNIMPIILEAVEEETNPAENEGATSTEEAQENTKEKGEQVEQEETKEETVQEIEAQAEIKEEAVEEAKEEVKTEAAEEKTEETAKEVVSVEQTEGIGGEQPNGNRGKGTNKAR